MSLVKSNKDKMNNNSRTPNNIRSKSKIRRRKTKQPKWDEQFENKIQESFSVQRKRNSNLRWGVIFGITSFVSGIGTIASPTFLSRTINLEQNDQNNIADTSFYIFVITLLLSCWSCIQGYKTYDENVKLFLRDQKSEKLIGLNRYEGVGIFGSGSKNNSKIKNKRNLAAQQRFARNNNNNNNNNMMQMNMNSRTPNNMRSNSYNNSRMRMNSNASQGGSVRNQGNMDNDRFANGSWSADVVLGKRVAQRRMLERGDYYRNGEEQFDMENLNGKLDFDMIDPKLDIRDMKTLRKFENAMRRSNIAERQKNGGRGGGYGNGLSNTRRFVGNYAGINRPTMQQFRPYEISEKVGQLAKSGASGSNFLLFNETYALAEEEYKRLGIDNKIDLWGENIKKWLPRIVMKYFLEPFDENKFHLNRLYNYDLDLLEHRKKVQRNYTANDGGASRFRTQARNSDKMTFEKMMAKFYERNSGAVVNQRPFLWIRKLLQSFLQVNGNTNESSCGYVLHRIRELCADGHFGDMIWDGGSKWKNKLWSTHRSPPMPCDAHIVMHLFCEYMNSLGLKENLPVLVKKCYSRPAQNQNNNATTTGITNDMMDYHREMPRSFSDSRYMDQDDSMDDGRGYHDLYIRLISHEPPYYAVIRNGKQIAIRPRHENVFDTIAVFLFFVAKDFNGSINSVSQVDDMQGGDDVPLRSFLKDDLLATDVLGGSVW